ncbi:COQ9 family protein [Sphingomonas morindae]|uniref:COQ9 family protein n=1 Tax=Sphingomonas morindae TaxID=1541170 RepID=A0ABY4X8U2_9SPHN|nr:COQ9 family protein [Sphingomonas morindae]USI73364.1 COQ9 family protein [Sphingomonas morindae]
MTALDLPLPADPTLDEMRASLGPAIAREAVFDGWSEAALANAARALGLDPAHARLAFPDGATGMIAAWYDAIDAALTRDFPPERVAAMKIRDRIGTLVRARLDYLRPQRQAARAAVAHLARPGQIAAGARLGWRAADTMWRLAGDTATDFNHYSKRATLAAIYAATLLVWLDDESEGESETAGFLARRLAGVMRFGKIKAQLLPSAERRFSLTRLAGRLRYPAL